MCMTERGTFKCKLSICARVCQEMYNFTFNYCQGEKITKKENKIGKKLLNT